MAARGKSAEELIVKIVAVGQNNDSRVSHRRFADDAPLLVNNLNRPPLSVDALPKSSRSFSKIHDGRWGRSERTWCQTFRASAALKLR